jgi:N-acetylneuraminic acid mutarotase
MQPIQRSLAVLFVASSVFAFSSAARAQGHWTKAAPFPEPMEETHAVTANGKLYVMGGFLPPGVAPGIVYEYDPASDTWTKKKTMPVPCHHMAMAEYRGKIYVMGGLVRGPKPGGWQPIDNAWEYDPATDSWKALPPMPGGKRGAAIAEEVGGKIYVIGGATTEPGTNEVALYSNRPQRSVGTNEAYDPATNTWETRSPMPTARNHAASGVVDGKIYVIGGRVGSAFIPIASNTDIVEEYDPATNTWGALRHRMPHGRSAVAYGTYGGKIYVAGGESQSDAINGVFRALEAYDPATNTWAILPSMPIGRHGLSGAFIGNGFHVVTGQVFNGEGKAFSSPNHDVFVVDK